MLLFELFNHKFFNHNLSLTFLKTFFFNAGHLTHTAFYNHNIELCDVIKTSRLMKDIFALCACSKMILNIFFSVRNLVENLDIFVKLNVKLANETLQARVI